MSEVMITFISFVISVVISLVFYIFVSKRNTVLFERAKSSGCVVIGRVVNVSHSLGTGNIEHSDANRENSVKVTYEYVVNGKSYKKKFVYTANGRGTVDYPSSLTFYYDKGNPKRVFIPSSKRFSSFIKLSLLLFVVCMFISIKILSGVLI